MDRRKFFKRSLVAATALAIAPLATSPSTNPVPLQGVWLIPIEAIPDNMTGKECIEEIKKNGVGFLKDVKGCKPKFVEKVSSLPFF